MPKALITRRTFQMTVGLGLIAVVPLAAGAGQAESDLIAKCVTLVQRYAAGEHLEAAAEARRLSVSELRRWSGWLVSLKSNAEERPTVPIDVSWCRPCTFREAWDRFRLQAAVTMHGEAAWPVTGPASRGSDDPTLNGDQLLTALALADLLPARTDGARTAVRFFLAVGYRLQFQGNLYDAQDWAKEGLKRFPQDLSLILHAGTIEEVIGTSGTLRGRPPNDAERTISRRARVGRERRESLAAAARLFQRALELQPDLHEARLRLGRVEWRREHHPDAERLFQEVLANASSTDTRYLAQLFLGRVREDTLRPEEAAQAYRGALALHPESQTALLALSHLLYRLGEDQASRDAVERSLAMACRKQRVDPFWVYGWGHSDNYDTVWESLRAEARAEIAP